MNLFDRLLLSLLYILPKKSISRLVGKLTKSSISKRLIPWFVKHYSIDQTQAEFNLNQYSSIGEFFVRKLKPGLRPIVQDTQQIASPVDGQVSQLGIIAAGQLIQAKGVKYSVLELLGQDQPKAALFEGGAFLAIYLSPSDYHRIHAPVSGSVTASTYIPGTLFPVNPFGVRVVKGLFSRNERLVTYLDSTVGTVALVKVGAIIVGSVKVNYSKAGTNIPRGKLATLEYTGKYQVNKGDELGRFEFGSTVILLFEPNKVVLAVEEGQRVFMGQQIALAKS